MRRKIARAAIAGVIASAAMMTGPVGAAQEADEEVTVSRFYLIGMDVDVARSGGLSVEMDWSFSFAGDHDDTFYLSFPEEQETAGGSRSVWRTPVTGISGAARMERLR